MKVCFVCGLVAATSLWAGAAVKLGTPFADGMVLQRDRSVPVWGTARPGEKVRVSFAGQIAATTAGADGAWRVDLRPMPASKESRTLTVNDLAVKDVLVGEVWFCSGQSNAEMPLVCPGPHFTERQGRLVAQMTHKPYIRYVYASDYKFSVKPKAYADYKVEWKTFTPENLGTDPSFSAMGVYFALELYSALEIPIGIVGACQGGTNIDAWTPRSGYAGKPSLKEVADWKVVDKDGWKPEMRHMPIWEVHQQPTVLWNEMVQPWCPMAMRGFIWYQGCHNSREAHLYCAKMHALYDGWSKEFQNPGLKLYFVQLAPYSDDWYDIQLAQAKFAAEEKNASMATTVDIGCWDDIHPGDKLPVGKRLAALALQHDYGFADIIGEPPTFRSAEVKDGKAVLSFDNASGWYVRNDDWSLLAGFELQAADGSWKPARLENADHGAKERKPYSTNGWVDGDKLVLAADGVDSPVAVRYLHEKPWQGHLHAKSGLALGPFEAKIEVGPAVAAYGAERVAESLGGEGWKLWLDRDAAYADDTLYVGSVDEAKLKSGAPDWWTPVDVAKVPVNPPTCGWDGLFGKSVAATEAKAAWNDRALSLDVSVPGTVEGYFFDAISGDRRGDRGSGDYRGVSWWGRAFDVPAAAKGRRVTLTFKEGFRYRAEVFVNRTLVAYDLSEHSPLTVDVSAAVKYGGRNELAVRITDATGEFSWGEFLFEKWGRYLFPASHGFGGILGDVELAVTDPVRVEDVFVKNKPNPREIETRIALANATDAAREVTVEAAVVENWADGCPVAKPKTILTKDLGRVAVPAKGTAVVDFGAVVEEARLWDVLKPNLYDLAVTLKDARGQVVDKTSVRFGFRFLEVRGVGEDAQFWLNGRRVFLLSAISWGYWPSNGMIPTRELARKHVKSAIELGMNMINFHRCRGNHEVLTAADEMGVLYYEEPGGYVSHRHRPDDGVGLDDKVAYELCRQKFLRMVADHRNHASLVIYNMVNEPGFGPDGRAKDTMACAHALDPSRLVVYGSGFMDAERRQDIKLHMLPYDDRQYDVGYCDIHNAGNSPGVYVDTNYNSPKGFLRNLRDEKEILVWGEEGALAAPPQLELIREQKKGQLNGWDGQQYDLWYEGMKSYIDRKGLAKNFPSLTKLLTSIGDIMYYEHGRLLENVRIADGAEAYILNGYESMKDDNLSGAVDCYRNHKGNPKLVSHYMKPLVMSVKAREKLGETGDTNKFDLWVLNNYAIPGGEYTVSAGVKTPSGKVRKFPDVKVRVSGGEKFSDLAAEGLQVKLDDGPGYYRIAAVLKDGAGKALAKGSDEMYAVDYRGTKIAARGAIVGGGPEYVRFARDVLKADLRPFAPSMGRLDYVLLAPTDQGEKLKTVPSFAFRSKDGGRVGLDMEYFRGKSFDQKVDHRVSTAPIDFNLGAKPIPGYDILGMTDFSLRWEGSVASDYTGDVTFEYSCDDGARVWFDGELVVDKWSDGPRTDHAFTRRMVAGERHAIKIEAYQSGGEWLASFRWKLPVPKQDVDLGALVRRVREDGTKLVLVEDAEAWLERLKPTGALPEYKVFHPSKTWVGHNMFVKDHPFFQGLPVNCGMNWEYQTLVVYDGPKHFGLVTEGEEPVVGLVGVPLRGIATSVGVFPCGKGKIVFSSLDLAPNLASDAKPSVTPKKIFANMLRWAGRL